MSKSSVNPRDKLSFWRKLIAVRPIFILPLVFACGIWLAYFVSLPFFFIGLIACFLLSLSVILTRRFLFFPSICVVFLVIGVLYGTNDRTRSNHDIAFSSVEGKLILEGIVATVPETVVKGRKETASFVLKVENFFREGSLHKSAGGVQVFLHNAGRAIHFGDRLRLRGILELPKEKRNPYSFDYSDYLAKRGVRRIFRGIGTFSVLRQQEGQANWFLVATNHFRTSLQFKLNQLFPSPHRDLAGALLLGFRKNIPRDIQDAFIKTGTAHLLAISGLNVSLVGGLFYFVLKLTGMPRFVNLVVTVGFITIYTLLAGANAPVVRAGIMGSVILLGFLLGEERNLKSAFFFSFFMILAVSPSALFQPSFQLSFIAMASLIFLLPKIQNSLTIARSKNGILRSISQTFLASLAATVGMFPVITWYFHLLSIVGFIANIIAIPLCTAAIASTLVLLLLDLIVPSLSHFFMFLPLSLFKIELWLIERFSDIPMGYFYLPCPPWYFFVFYYGFLAAWLFCPAKRFLIQIRSACPLAMVLTTGFCLLEAFPPSPRFVFFDLGKTEAALMTFSNGAHCLINTGRAFPNDQAYWILRPFLMASGIQKLDCVVFTKLDGRHAGGFQTLSRHIRLKKICVPGLFQKSARNQYVDRHAYKKLEIYSLLKDDRIRFGAQPESYIEALVNTRGEILALEIHDGAHRLLYVASARAETFQMLSQFSDLNYDLAFLPHHEFGISESEEHVLKRLSCQFIISNQREDAGEFRMKLKSLVQSKILFLEDAGAAELLWSGKRWICEPSLRLRSEEKRTYRLIPAL